METETTGNLGSIAVIVLLSCGEKGTALQPVNAPSVIARQINDFIFLLRDVLDNGCCMNGNLLRFGFCTGMM